MSKMKSFISVADAITGEVLFEGTLQQFVDSFYHQTFYDISLSLDCDCFNFKFDF